MDLLGEGIGKPLIDHIFKWILVYQFSNYRVVRDHEVYNMKLTKKMFTLVFLTFTCAFTFTYACENQSCNMNKLDEVQKVEHTYIPFKTEDFLKETTEGGSYTYYKNKDNVTRKIRMIVYGEIGKIEVTYYLLSEKNYKIQYKKFTYTNFIYAEDSEIDSVTSGTIYICYNKEIVSAPDTKDKVKNFKRRLKTVLDKISETDEKSN